MCCRNSVLLSYVSPLGLGFLEQEFLRGRRRPSGSLFRNLARFGVSAAHLMHSIDVNTTPVSACTPNWNLNPKTWKTETWKEFTGNLGLFYLLHVNWSARTWRPLFESFKVLRHFFPFFVGGWQHNRKPLSRATSLPYPSPACARTLLLWREDVGAYVIASSAFQKAVREFSANLQWSARSLGSWQSTKYLTVTLGCFGG